MQHVDLRETPGDQLLKEGFVKFYKLYPNQSLALLPLAIRLCMMLCSVMQSFPQGYTDIYNTFIITTTRTNKI
eukprot:UN08385